MEINDQLKLKFSSKPKKSKHLHSPNHLLADELSKRMREPKRFGFYLKMAEKHDHSVLRRIAGFVLENDNAKKPGALFAFLIKKEFPKNDTSNPKISS
ncbi:MAG: hypothetical protein NVSMB66_1840 [Candidatus Doudnabacteria bacterium]